MMLTQSAFTVLLAAVCGLLPCSAALASPAAGPETEPKASAVARLVQSEMAARGIPGVQLAIIQKQKIVFSGAYGLAHLAAPTPASAASSPTPPISPSPVTEHTLFPVNSISKAVAGVAVMQLVEDGVLDLDAPLKRYLETLPESWGGVSVRQALTHMSGLPEIVDDNVRAIDGAGPDLAWKKVQELPLDFPPGTRFDYTQTNYVLIGKLIEALSKKSYAEFVRERQFDVAGLKRTRFTADAQADTASLYTYLTLQIKGMKTVGVERSALPLLRQEPMAPYMDAAGGVKTTASDLAAWVIAVQKLSLLSQKGLEQLWQPQAQKDGSYRGFNALVNGYGLGWPSARRSSHPALALVGGARAAVFIYPEDELAVLVLTNLMGASPEKFIDKIASIYLPAATPVLP